MVITLIIALILYLVLMVLCGLLIIDDVCKSIEAFKKQQYGYGIMYAVFALLWLFIMFD